PCTTLFRSERELSAQLEDHERTAERVRSERVAEAATAKTHLELLAAEGDQLRAALAATESERERLGAQVEGAAAARTHLEAALERTVEEARTREQRLSGRLEEHEREAERLRTERAAEAAAAAERGE